jgi:glyoxylase-like metal-dependent hydrolase (beta-lactamase superfamily II)
MVRRLALVLLLTGCSATTPRSAPTPLPGETVAPDIALVRGRFIAGEQPDGNSVLLRGPGGLVVFDTGRHAEHAQHLLDDAHTSGQPIVAIVNSHWHLDHVSGNVPLRAAFPHAEVYASDAIHAAMQGFLADYRAQLVALLAKTPADDPQAIAWREELARIDAGPKLFPTRIVQAPMETTLAGRHVHLGLERNAVSGGDVWLLDPATRTLLSGDLVTLPAPLFDTACATGWRDALARLDALPFDTLVPGHGAPMTHAQFTVWRGAFDRLLVCAAGSADNSTCAAGWMHDAGPLIPESDRALAATLLDYYIPQVLRAPVAHRDRYCHADAGA